MTSLAEKRDHRNAHGVKDSADLYRTVRGVHYAQYSNAYVEKRIVAYKAAGIRFRSIKYDGVAELFVPKEDWDRAREIDEANGWHF